MDYHIKIDAPDRVATDCLVLGCFEERKWPTTFGVLDPGLAECLGKLAKRDHFAGKVGDVLLLNSLSAIDAGKSERVLLIGLGKKDALDVGKFRKAMALAAKCLRDSQSKSAAIWLPELSVSGGVGGIRWIVRQSVEIIGSAAYRFTKLKKDADDKPLRLQSITFLVAKPLKSEAERGLREGEAIAYGMRIVRDLANLPGNICTPSYLAREAEHLGEEHSKLNVQILDEQEIERLGMGAFLSVAKGSRQPPRLIAMEYRGGSAKSKPIVFIGKGLTFDAGGISLKPAANMDEMKYDMCGGATVIGVMAAVERLRLPLNVIGLVPSSENLPDGNANKPGDIVESMEGLTIEILNTDAEGRLLLCDVLTYAKRYDPCAVIDIATLTGACIVALGRHPSGLMGNQDTLCDALIEAGQMAGDRVWRFPLWDEYHDQLKSNFADLANIGGPDGGAITAGCFLSRFAKEFPWAHLDIAGTAWRTGQDKGATGRPLSLLMTYLIAQTR